MSDSTQLIRRKGICKNPDCDMCMSREVQEIEPGEDFICSDCGAPLQDVGDKPSNGGGGDGGSKRTLMLAIICAVVAILCGVGYWFFVANSSSDDVTTTGTDSTEVTTPQGQGENVTTGGNNGNGNNGTTTQPGGGNGGGAVASGTVSLGNGTYNGPLKGGKPDGIGGTFTCSRAFTLDLKDGYGNTVDLAAGDKIIDTKFDGGKLQQGEIHFANGTRKYISGLNATL